MKTVCMKLLWKIWDKSN